MENDKKINLGKEGEKEAAKFLKKKGYKILDRNFRVKGGELDIVAEKSGEIVFVEVKARSSDKFMEPVEAITPKKRKSLRKAAEIFLLSKKLDLNPCRFDVITIIKKAGKSKIEHLENVYI